MISKMTGYWCPDTSLYAHWNEIVVTYLRLDKNMFFSTVDIYSVDMFDSIWMNKNLFWSSSLNRFLCKGGPDGKLVLMRGILL